MELVESRRMFGVRASGSTPWLAALLTLAMFVALPLLERVSSRSASRVAAFEVQRVEPLPPPPPPPEPRVRRDRESLPRPRLVEPRRLIPVEAMLRLDLNLGNLAGDFALDFNVAAPDLMGEVGQYIFAISEIDQPPQPLARIPPQYPPRARMRRIEGSVETEFVIGVDGGVSGAVVVDATPPGVFEEAALRAIGRWRFEPGTKDGRPVPVRVRQRLEFKLGD